jgi:hypothetical protein
LYLPKGRCVLCGGLCDDSAIEFTLWDNDERVGFVCEDCVAAGAANIKSRIRENIADEAEYLEFLKGAVNEDIVFPDPEEIKKLEEAEAKGEDV